MNGFSICIPVYNFNCLESVKSLCKQIQTLDVSAEVLAVDDASDLEFYDLANYENKNYNYERLEHNLGRSKIRNYLAQKSKYSHILFIDGDSGIQDNFLNSYLVALTKNRNAIIYGGTIQPEKSNKTKGLRNNYSAHFEFKPPSKRNEKPYLNFRTNNFVVPKEVILKTPFNENLNKYGHEDTFFAYEMRQKNIKVVHIDNPVIHFDNGSNSDFIQKTKESIENLVLIYKEHPEFIEYNELLKFVKTKQILNYKVSKKVSNVFSKVFETLARNTNNTYFFQAFKLFYITSIH
jgi:hypothetical protein